MKHFDKLMDDTDKMLIEIFGTQKAADSWWYEENFAFGLKSPMMMWYSKHQDFVYKFVSDAYHKKCQK